jgi:poly-gamma-glutamate capsule biosynthesis protein CapA/YwtB (metallophosphatase superfamily)
MRDAGFDVISLANNHVFDFGAGGLEDTLAHVRAAGLEPVGAGVTAEEARREVVVEVRGVRVGFLAFTEMTNEHLSSTGFVGRLDQATARVAEVSARVDVLLVSLHWGVQFHARPGRWQRRLAQRLIDAGADAIIGHHPHVLQTVETYAGKPIVYSLGNFVFGPQPTPRDASAIAEVEIASGHVTSLRMIPVMLGGVAGSPIVATDARGERSRSRLRSALAWTDEQGVLALGLAMRP